jgi:biopolymer transport protein ExbB
MANGLAAHADEAPAPPPIQDLVARDFGALSTRLIELYHRTPWTDRVAWGALGACAVLAGLTILERTWAMRTRKILPKRFVNRLMERLEDGPVDRAKLVDLCELNDSAVARIAGAVVSRWGRPTADLERALSHGVRVEAEELQRNVPTLRRIAVLSPLLGLLGTLMMVGRLLQSRAAADFQQQWTHLLAQSLFPLTGGVMLAVLALISYDGLCVRVSKYVSRLEKIGVKLVDQVALATPPSDARLMIEPPPLLHRPHVGPGGRREPGYDRDGYSEGRQRSGKRRKAVDPIDLDDLDD